MTDPISRAVDLQRELELAEAAASAIRARRDDAVRDANAAGSSGYQIAKALGVAQTSVAHILGRRKTRTPEDIDRARALLSGIADRVELKQWYCGECREVHTIAIGYQGTARPMPDVICVCTRRVKIVQASPHAPTDG